MFIGYQGRSIVCVSDVRPEGQKFDVIEVAHLAVSHSEIFKNYEVVDGKLFNKNEVRDPKTLRVAMIASYGINCGMATYAKYLCDEMRKQVKELRIFAEMAPEASVEADAADNVVRCWDRKGAQYMGILDQVRSYNPDIVYVQHEYGCFNHGARWNSLIGHLNAQFRTIVVLHSVYEQQDKLIFETPCKEIITHSLPGRDILKKRGIDHCPIHYVPHGCVGVKPIDTKFSKMDSEYVIFQYGFGFEYKGWDQAIDIVDRLRVLYPDILYVGIFNISKFSEEFGNYYYAKLMKNIRDRGLEKHVVLHKGFRSEEALLSYMSQSKVNLFPYWNHHEWRVYGASGAIRLALASGTPTVVGDVPFFAELRGYIPVCGSIDHYVDQISKLLSEPQYREEIQGRMKDFINERTWDKVAAWYLACTPNHDFTAEPAKHES